MRNLINKQLVRAALRFSIPAAFAFAMQILGPLSAVQRVTSSEEGRAPAKALSRMLLPGTQDLQLVIQLSSPSVVEWMQAEGGRRSAQTASMANEQPRMNLQSLQVGAYRMQVARERQLVTDRLSAMPGVQIQSSTDTVMNAVIARVPVESYSEVRSLPGVKKVYFSRPQRMHLDASASLINAQGLWTKAGGRAQAGKGIKIGIIDSGIDNTHPMFIDSSLVPPSGFPKGETGLTNSKVIVARNYMSLLANRQTVRTAVDEMGHGTFVAGVAAGKQVDAPLGTISGTAPGAFLGNYKVFGTPGVNDTTTNAAIVAAVDAAVADGMDVLNLSLGALDYIPPSEDPEVAALETAIAAGVVVTISAGNDGPETHTIGSPGTAPDAITVGSVTNSRMFASPLQVTAPAPVPSNLASVAYVPGSGPAITSKIPAAGVVDVTTLDSNGYACSPFPSGSLSGKIAFVERGGVGSRCTFLVKVNNSASAGATAVVVYNDNPTEGPISMGNLSSTLIPAVMISNADGLALKSYLAANPGSVQIAIDDSSTIVAVPTAARVLASSSSVGPGMDFSIKPDLVAVGVNVYSAAGSNPNGILYSPTKFTVSQGTSFAAPMVAGAAAGLRQLFPNLSPAAIKSILASNASQAVTIDGSNPPGILQIGSGLLDMAAAAAAGASFAPANLNFGTRSYSGTLSLTRTLTITNILSSTDQYTLSVNQIVPGPVITFKQTDTGSVAPGGTTSVDVTLQVTSPLSRGFQGFVAVQSSATSAVYRIPYWAGLFVPDPSRILTVAQNQPTAGSFGSLAAAVRAARPGNIIEIADSGTYPAGLIISTNDEGLPLHGLTIRAKSGQMPTLDGTTTDADADIHIIGLQNVSLQGLIINAGPTGVLLSRPTPDTPLSATIDHCTISNTSDANGGGIIAEAGGTLHVTKSIVSNSKGAGILVFDGTYLTVLGTTVQGNGSDGIDAYFSNVEILNSTIPGNTGPGLYLESSSGTIDGSTFSQNHGDFGDGIEIADGNFTITNNTFDSNDRAGVGFFNATSRTAGPVVRLAGNTLRTNTKYGVLANPAQSLLLDGNLIKDNGRGVRLTGSTAALLVNNIVVRSTDTSSGNGIEVAGSSNAAIVNNTIYRNILRGVSLSSGGSASVLNSIVSANGTGDLQGFQPSNVQFSLIGDGTFTTTNNNITGDPKFANPDSTDFSLSTGSPALDAGSNAVPNLPFLDFNRQLRVAPAPPGVALPGDGKVDMGAIEANSSFPLIFPLLANGTQPVLGDTVITGYAVLNYGSSGITNFAAFGPDGGLLPGSTNPSARSIGAGSQIPRFAYELFGFASNTPSLGGVLATSVQRLAGFFLLFDAGLSRYADGANASDQTTVDLLFMRHQFDSSGKARYIVFNPGVNPASVTATPISSQGAALDVSKTSTVAPKGQFVFTFDNVTSSSGWVRLQSDRPVSGLEIFGNSQGLATLGGVSAGSEARLFFPHFAVNGGFSSLIGIVNASGTQADIVLTAHDSSGQTLGAPALITLATNAQLLQPVDSLFGIGPGPLTTGYIVAESDQPGVQGFTQFTYDDGVNKSGAAVPADSVPRQLLLFSHVAHQVPAGLGGTYQTGIALLNPFGTTVGYTIRVFDASGVKVAEKIDTLAPGQKIAKILSHPVAGAAFFTQSLPLASGHVEVETDYGLLGFELFFTETFSQLASVPAQTLK